MTIFEQLPQAMPAPMAEQLPPVGAELLAAPLELSEQIGHTAVQTELEITEAAVAGRYDHLTTPLPADKDKLEQALGLSDSPDSDSYLESIAWQSEVDRPNMRVAINMPVNVLPRFFKSGAYKSAVETGIGTSPNRGINEINRGYRTEQEPDLVYGYLTTEGTSAAELPNVAGYGGVQIILKPEVVSRSTFTGNDSMDMNMNASSLLNAEDAMLIEQSRRLRSQTGTVGSNAKYVEAQIHEGVSLEDIQEIKVPLDVSTLTTGDSLKSTIELLETNMPEEAKKTIQIDVTEGMYEANTVLDLIQAHPTITFELVVRQTRYEGDRETRQAAFIERKMGNDGETITRMHQRMEDRFSKLSESIPKYAEKIGMQIVPPNLTLVKEVNNRSFSAAKESNDRHGLIAKQAA